MVGAAFSIWVFTQSKGMTNEVFTKATITEAGISNFVDISCLSGICIIFLIWCLTNKSVSRKTDQAIACLINKGVKPLKSSVDNLDLFSAKNYLYDIFSS